MNIEIMVMNPAGNVTALAKEQLSDDERIVFSGEIMQREDMKVEQVGFLTPPQHGGTIRVEMMGGEFCGNAVRCAGLYAAIEQQICGQAIVPVEISGCAHCVAVAVDTNSGEARATMPLPILCEMREIDDISAFVCEFEGIVHLVLFDEYPEQEIIDKLLQYVTLNFHADAIGLIFVDMESQMLWPVVFVPAIGSLVFENSCASGTVAASAFWAREQQDGRYKLEWHQPGGILNVDLQKSEGILKRIVLGGKIEIEKKQIIEFEME